MHAGNGVERIHAVRSIHPEGESLRMPRRQGGLPSMSETAFACMRWKQRSGTVVKDRVAAGCDNAPIIKAPYSKQRRKGSTFRLQPRPGVAVIMKHHTVRTVAHNIKIVCCNSMTIIQAVLRGVEVFLGPRLPLIV